MARALEHIMQSAACLARRRERFGIARWPRQDMFQPQRLRKGCPVDWHKQACCALAGDVERDQGQPFTRTGLEDERWRQERLPVLEQKRPYAKRSDASVRQVLVGR